MAGDDKKQDKPKWVDVATTLLALAAFVYGWGKDRQTVAAESAKSATERVTKERDNAEAAKQRDTDRAFQSRLDAEEKAFKRSEDVSSRLFANGIESMRITADRQRELLDLANRSQEGVLNRQVDMLKQANDRQIASFNRQVNLQAAEIETAQERFRNFRQPLYLEKLKACQEVFHALDKVISQSDRGQVRSGFNKFWECYWTDMLLLEDEATCQQMVVIGDLMLPFPQGSESKDQRVANAMAMRSKNVVAGRQIQLDQLFSYELLDTRRSAIRKAEIELKNIIMESFKQDWGIKPFKSNPISETMEKVLNSPPSL